jgi:hypothetical protein
VSQPVRNDPSGLIAQLLTDADVMQKAVMQDVGSVSSLLLSSGVLRRFEHFQRELKTSLTTCAAQFPSIQQACISIVQLRIGESPSGTWLSRLEATDYLDRVMNALRAMLKEWKPPPARQSSEVHFSAPAGAAWPDVSVRFLSDQRVQIWVGEVTEVLNYKEMGFEDRRSHKPNSAWILLRELAKKGGTTHRPKDFQTSPNTLEKQVQILRKLLRSFFGIPEDPFHPYHARRRYETKFHVEFPDSDLL